MCKVQIKKTIQNGLVILVITCVLISFCEVTLRLVFRKALELNNREQKKIRELAYKFNEKYLVSLKPDINKKFRRSQHNGGNLICWQTNKDSFRGADLNDNSDFRIIVYGDSNVHARFSYLEDTFSCKLEGYLKEVTKKNIEVINAGIVGFGPDQSLIRFMQEAEMYKPDLVIFHVFADNDFGDIIRNRLFKLDSSGNLIKTGYKNRLLERKWLDYPTQGIQYKFKSFFSSLIISRMVRKLSKKVMPVHQHKKEVISAVGDISDDLRELLDIKEEEYYIYKRSKPRSYPFNADSFDLDVALFPGSEASTIKVGLMNGVLEKAKLFAEGKNVEFMVLIQPSSHDLSTNSEPNYKEFSKYPGYKRHNLTSIVDNICEKEHIHRLNLFDIFLQNNADNLFFKEKNNHWNDKGQEIAAEKTAEYISRYLLPKSRVYDY